MLRCCASTVMRHASTARPRSTPSGPGWNARSRRTSPTGSGCSSTWPSGPCRTRRSSIRPRPSRRWTGSTTACGNWQCRRLPDGRWHDDDGRVRLTVPVMDWEAYVHLAFDEIRIAGAHSPQVSRRLTAALNDLLLVAPPERHRVLEEQLESLRRALEHESEQRTLVRPHPRRPGDRCRRRQHRSLVAPRPPAGESRGVMPGLSARGSPRRPRAAR